MRISMIFALSICVQGLNAEDGFKRAEVSFGDSAFTSGLNLALDFKVGVKKDFELVGNSERFFGVLSYALTPKLEVESSGGVFKGLPWAGPRVVYRPHEKVMLMYWGGVSPGRVEERKGGLKSFFQQGTVYSQIHNNLVFGYTVIKFDVYKTNQLPEIVLSKRLTDKVVIKFSVTYNVNEKKPLYMTALVYQPK